MSMTTTPDTHLDPHAGDTVHILRGSKYAGAWTLTADPVLRPDGWLEIRGNGAQWFARPCDLFATEVDARTEAKARRRPRTPRTGTTLYGDYATIAMLNGIRLDGTRR